MAVEFRADKVAFVCTNCGDLYKPQLPMDIERFVEILQWFADRHNHCKKPKGPGFAKPRDWELK